MPTFAVLLKAELEGIEQITPVEGRSWMLKFNCTKCNTVTPNFVEVDPTETAEVGGGTSNLAFKCKECKSVISATVVPRTEGGFGAKPGKVVEIDIRGGEPVDLLLDDGWNAVGEGETATAFTGVTLDDFCDYDEPAETSVTISKPEVSFARK